MRKLLIGIFALVSLSSFADVGEKKRDLKIKVVNQQNKIVKLEEKIEGLINSVIKEKQKKLDDYVAFMNKHFVENDPDNLPKEYLEKLMVYAQSTFNYLGECGEGILPEYTSRDLIKRKLASIQLASTGVNYTAESLGTTLNHEELAQSMHDFFCTTDHVGALITN